MSVDDPSAKDAGRGFTALAASGKVRPLPRNDGRVYISPDGETFVATKAHDAHMRALARRIQRLPDPVAYVFKAVVRTAKGNV